MPDRIGGILIPRWNSDEGPSTAKVFGVPVILRPAAGKDLDMLVGLGGAGDVMKRTIGQIIEWRGMCLEGDMFLGMRSA